MPRVVVCGLGPATADLGTAETAAAIGRIPHRFLRTARHPSADAVGEAATFDHLYETAETFDEVYDGIVAAVQPAEWKPLVADFTRAYQELRYGNRREAAHEMLDLLQTLERAR